MNLQTLVKGLGILTFVAVAFCLPSDSFAQWRNVGSVPLFKGMIPADSCQFRAKILLSSADDLSSSGYTIGYLDLQAEKDTAWRVSSTSAKRQLTLSGLVGGKLQLPFQALLSSTDQAALTSWFNSSPDSDGRTKNYKFQLFFQDDLKVSSTGPLLLNASLVSRSVSGKIAVEQMGTFGAFEEANLSTNLNLSKVQLQVDCGTSTVSATPTPYPM